MRHFFLTVALLILLGCARSPVTADEITFQRSVWQRQSIAAYSFDLKISCFCDSALTSPKKVWVGPDRSVRITEANNRPTASKSPFLGDIDAIIDVLEDAAKLEPDGLDVAWNKDLGYPKLIKIDRREAAIDDEMEVKITNFRVL